jgi:hypothetical protein
MEVIKERQGVVNYDIISPNYPRRMVGGINWD